MRYFVYGSNSSEGEGWDFYFMYKLYKFCFNRRLYDSETFYQTAKR